MSYQRKKGRKEGKRKQDDTATGHLGTFSGRGYKHCLLLVDSTKRLRLSDMGPMYIQYR